MKENRALLEESEIGVIFSPRVIDLLAQLRRKITDGVIAPPLTLLLLLGSQPGVIN